MHTSPLQQITNGYLQGRYGSPLSAALNQRPHPLINIGVTPSSLLAVLHEQDRQRYAMVGAALQHYSCIGNIDSTALLDLMDGQHEDEEDQDEVEVDSENGTAQHLLLDSVGLAACRESVKAELADLEKERKALNGQQNALNRRFAEVEGKFQLIKQLESEITTNNAMNAQANNKTD